MKAAEIIRKLKEVSPDKDVTVDVVLYSSICPDMVQVKRFTDMNFHNGNITVNAPDDEEWETHDGSSSGDDGEYEGQG